MALQEFCDTRPELLADPIVQLVKKVTWTYLANRVHKLTLPFRRTRLRPAYSKSTARPRTRTRTSTQLPVSDSDPRRRRDTWTQRLRAGCVLYHYGLTQFKVCHTALAIHAGRSHLSYQYYTVIFGVSRGCAIVFLRYSASTDRASQHLAVSRSTYGRKVRRPSQSILGAESHGPTSSTRPAH